MQSLKEMRDEMDVIDSQIKELYRRRVEICGHVAEYKIQNGI